MLLSCHPDVDRDENIKAVLRILNLLQGGYQEEEVVHNVEYTRERLNEMVLPDIRVI
jgi:hypothetical protein